MLLIFGFIANIMTVVRARALSTCQHGWSCLSPLRLSGADLEEKTCWTFEVARALALPRVEFSRYVRFGKDDTWDDGDL